MALSLTCAARLTVITADFAPVARIASLFSGFAFSAQDVVDLISVHEAVCVKDLLDPTILGRRLLRK